MTGVYERALGDAADDLHPKVRERYGIGPGDDACVGRGRMDITRAPHLVPVFYAMTREDMLFPEAGDDVPFSVTTVGYRTDAGHEALTTRRTFEFGETTRRFDTLTVWDAANDRLVDYLGRNGYVASELRPRVEDGALVVEGGRQWLRVGERYVRIPGPMAADLEVRDRYDEGDEQFHVTATVESTLAGRMFTYRGAFTQTFEACDPVPDDLRPSAGLGALPPR